MTYNIQHKNDGKNYIYRDGSGTIKILYNQDIVINGLIVHLDSTQYVASASASITWYDLSGYNNNAKLYNGVIHDGKFFVFDGIDEYAEITNNSTINSCLSSNFTYEIWVYLQTGGNLWSKVFSKGLYTFKTGAFNGLTHYLPGSLFWQYMPTGGSSAELFYSTPIKNAWTQLVYTRTSGVMKFYRNGVLQATANNSVNFGSNYNLRISANSSTALEPSRQKVMIFRQYNRGLNAAEVLQNYNASVGKTINTGFTALADCGHCNYNYNYSLHEWQLSSSDCYGNCSCPSKQYVNEYDQSANGCANAADCSACQTSCVEDLYANRSFVAFNSSEINKIDFNYILETDETTLRKSADGSLTFVKWTGSAPSFIQNMTTKQNTSGYNQLSSDINSSGWSESSAPVP